MEPLSLVERLRRAPAFSDLLFRVDRVIAPELETYSDRLSSRWTTPESKAFKDAVWGMIDLAPKEVLVIDSPPFQRLRLVKQLGLTSLTYPTAGYSRFEHTLGAVHQAERMLRTIVERSAQHGDDVLAARETVRLAALLHDVGHLPLSHVSERYYTRAECSDDDLMDQLEAAIADVAQILEVPAPRLSECLSIAVAISPSFWRLLTESIGYDSKLVASATVAIVGRPPTAGAAFVAQMISNVIDADKLDYMFRDAFVTRVPLGVDLERLLFKLQCVSAEASDLRGALRSLADEAGTALVLGTDLAGNRLVYDLAISREMLFERIYLHHKTRSAERVAMRLLHSIGIHPADLLAYDDRVLIDRGFVKKHHGEVELTDVLVKRNLPRRAFAASYAFLVDRAPVGDTGRPAVSPEDQAAWDDFGERLASRDPRTLLEQEILAEARCLAELLSLEPPSAVWVDTPPQRFEIDESHLFVRLPDGSLTTGASFPAQAAAFAHSPAAMSFIYVTGGDDAPYLIYVSAELILLRDLSLFLGRAAADYAKVDMRRVVELKRRLLAADPTLFDSFAALQPDINE